MNRSSLAVLAALVTASFMALPASAQAPLAGDYGGGAITEHDPFHHHAPHDVLLGIGVGADRRVALEIRINARCAASAARASTALRPDGTFAVSGRETERFPHGFRVSSRYTVRGAITPQGGQGTATAFVTQRHGRHVRRCSTRNVHWRVRPGHQPVQPAAPATAGATLYGTTDQSTSGTHEPVAFRVSRNGRRMEAGLTGFRQLCRGGLGFTSPSTIDIVRPATIASDGSFRSVERHRNRLGRTVDREVIVFAGHFTQNGATGTLSFTDRLSDRRTGKAVDTCTTGQVAWTALR